MNTWVLAATAAVSVLTGCEQAPYDFASCLDQASRRPTTQGVKAAAAACELRWEAPAAGPSIKADPSKEWFALRREGVPGPLSAWTARLGAPSYVSTPMKCSVLAGENIDEAQGKSYCAAHHWEDTRAGRSGVYFIAAATLGENPKVVSASVDSLPKYHGD